MRNRLIPSGMPPGMSSYTLAKYASNLVSPYVSSELEESLPWLDLWHMRDQLEHVIIDTTLA